MAIQAVNIFTQKRNFNYEEYSPMPEEIQDASVAQSSQESDEMSAFRAFLQNEIAHINGYKDADSMLNETSLFPKGRDLSNIGSKWRINKKEATVLSNLNKLQSFNTQNNDIIGDAKVSASEKLEKELEKEEQALSSLKEQRDKKQRELNQGYVMVVETNKKGESVLKKKKLKKKNNNGYNKEEWQNAINELDAKILSKEQLISNYKQTLEHLSS